MEPKFITIALTVYIHEEQEKKGVDSFGMAESCVTLPISASTGIELNRVRDGLLQLAVADAVQKGLIKITVPTLTAQTAEDSKEAAPGLEPHTYPKKPTK